MADEPKPTRVPLEKLKEALALGGDEAVVVYELRRMLIRQAERDVVIEELRSIVHTLVAGQVATVEEMRDEIGKLQHAYDVLLDQQRELNERQGIISAVCDAFAKRLEDQEKTTKSLLDSADEP